MKIQPVVSRAIGFADLSRTGLIRLISKLLMELPDDAPQFSQRRSSGDSDCFDYRLAIFDQEMDAPRRFLFRFQVNDTLNPGILLVVNVRFSSRPGPTPAV